MGPLWCRQGTVPHTTLSDLLPTDVLVSFPGKPVGAAQVMITEFGIIIISYIPADAVLVEEVTSLLLLLSSNIAITLTLQLLPGVAGTIV